MNNGDQDNTIRTVTKNKITTPHIKIIVIPRIIDQEFSYINIKFTLNTKSIQKM